MDEGAKKNQIYLKLKYKDKKKMSSKLIQNKIKTNFGVYK